MTLPKAASESALLIPTQSQVLTALAGIHQLCLQVKDRQSASLQLHARLHQVFLRIAHCATHQTLAPSFDMRSFMRVLSHGRTVLETHVKLRNVVLRLLASRRFLAGLRRVHNELTAFITKWTLASATSAAMHWQQQLALNTHLDEQTLLATLRALLATPTFVHKEFGSERRQLFVLLDLVAEFAPERERAAAHSPQLLAALQFVHKRISTAAGLHVRRVPRWYLPRADVVCLEPSRVVGRGSFGATLFRGDYYGNDVGSTRGHVVAVKYLWPLQGVHAAHVEHLFAQTLQRWWHIRHPNIAQVRGASHVAAPPYIVRDYTAYGSLTSYVAAVQAHAKRPDASRTGANLERITWELLYGATKGLLYLHERMQLVHGGLCCSNILVDRSGQPVLADYGLRALACQVQRHGLALDPNARVDDRERVRWLAPECLLDELDGVGCAGSVPAAYSDSTSEPVSCTTTLTYASDVYALGMSILEAVTGAVPWIGLDAAEVRKLKRTLGMLPPRPKRMHPNVWGLVQRMCVADPRERLALRDVLFEIKQLGYFGYDAPAAPSDTESGSSLDALSQADADSAVIDSADVPGRSVDAVELVYLTGQGHQDADFVDVDELESPLPPRDAVVAPRIKRQTSAGALSTDEPLAAQVAMHHSVSGVAVKSRVKTTDCKSIEATTAAAATASGSAAIVVGAAEVATKATSGASSRRFVRASSAPVHKAANGSSTTRSGAASAQSPSLVVPRRVASSTRVPSERIRKIASSLRSEPRSSDAVREQRQSAIDSSVTDDNEIESANIWGNSDVAVERVGVHVDVAKVASVYHDARDSNVDDDDDDDESLTHSDCEVDTLDSVACSGVSAHDTEVCRSFRRDVKQRHAPSTDGSTVEPELEIEICDVPAAAVVHKVTNESAPTTPTSSKQSDDDDDAPLSRTTEILNRHQSGARGGDRSSFLDTLLRATVLLSDEYMTAHEPADVVTAAAAAAAAAGVPPLSLPQYVDTVEALQASRSPDVVLHALQMLRGALRRGAHEVDWTERGGVAALLGVLERGVSEPCTRLALDLLVEIAVQQPGDMETMVESGAVRVLLAFIANHGASHELDVVASFLLEILASSDVAKTQLWQSDGIRVVETNGGIDRRLVQEVKSIVAKFKSSEGYKHMNQGEYDLAIERFSDAIALDRKRATYYCDRSLAYFEASLFKKAADDAARCMRYNPYDAIGYLRNGMALKALGRYNEAIACLRKGRQVDPKFAKIRDVLSEIDDIRRGRSRETSCEAPTVLPEEVVKAKKKDGDDALRRREYDVAIQCYTEALAVDKRNDLIFLHRSIAYSGCGQFDKAIDDASRCIQINYRHAEGYYRLALALNSVKQYDQALRTLYRGQDVDTRHAGIRRFIQQLEQEQAKRAGLDLATWFKDKGYEAFQLRSYEEAIKFYSKGIAASASDHDDVALHCFFYRARANQCRGEFSAVVMDCTHILHHNPKNVFARLRRADAYEQQRDYFMALQDMQELVMFNPDFETARARLESLEVRCRFLPRTNLQHDML